MIGVGDPGVAVHIGTGTFERLKNKDCINLEIVITPISATIMVGKVPA